ncbi:carbohydrate ABC transporter permease [Gracilibacillus phocaeensis]|uniref:carbohydrate ABC transporter permease n=1 Tax=Gracilibacillus phocaeensis TaxID=2042304 RepID=UPI001030A63F|nr:carbohydrate ABC transporter permease [Gracilibacillus phocaeensis]
MISNIITKLSKAFVYIWVGFILFVFFWVFLASIKTDQELLSDFWTLPSNFQWSNYVFAWINSNLAAYFFNSIIVVLVSIIGLIIISSPAAYILSRVKFKGRGFITISFIIGIAVPHQAILIPLYLLMVNMGLINSLTGVIIVYIVYSLPFTIFILTGFFSTISSEVEEAAAIEGATPNQTFWKIVLPMIRPGIITVVILNGVGLWNEFLFAYTFLNSGEKYTLSVGLYKFYQTMEYNSNWVSLYAGVVIIIIPILLFYLWLSGRIIEGMTAGSGK